MTMFNARQLKSRAPELRKFAVVSINLGAALAAGAAQAAGTGMPWEQPLQQVLDSVQGPVAKILAVIVIIVTGLTPPPASFLPSSASAAGR
jgi:type IV secretory pathway VirB2 component (pilin)